MSIATMRQQPPCPTGGPAIWDLVVADVSAALDPSVAAPLVEDMRDRDQVGLELYGVRLQAGNGRDALVDAYQESLDQCVYLRQAIAEGQTGLCGIYAAALGLMVQIRRAIK